MHQTDHTDQTTALDIAYGALDRRAQVAYQVIGIHPDGPVATTAVAAALGISAPHATIVLEHLCTADLITASGQDEWNASDQVRAHAAACAHTDPYRDSCNASTAQVITTHLIDYYRLGLNAANHRLLPHRPILHAPTDIPRSFPLPVFDSVDAARSWLRQHWETIRHFWRLATTAHPFMGAQYIDGMEIGRKFLRREDDALTMLTEAQEAGRLALTTGERDIALTCAAHIDDLARLVGDGRALAAAAALRAAVHRLRREYAVAVRFYGQEQEILASLTRTPGIASDDRALALGRSLIESAAVRSELGTWWTAATDARRAVTLLRNLPRGDDLDLARARIELVAASIPGIDGTQLRELYRLAVRINLALLVVNQQGGPHVVERAYRVAAALAQRFPAAFATGLPVALYAYADQHGARAAHITAKPRPSLAAAGNSTAAPINTADAATVTAETPDHGRVLPAVDPEREDAKS